VNERVEANRRVIEEFRANGGVVAGQFAGRTERPIPVVVLTPYD
jgi:hypothetical protein